MDWSLGPANMGVGIIIEVFGSSLAALVPASSRVSKRVTRACS
jgi:hypothetical protein